MAQKILIAGASGRLGRHIVQSAKERGYYVRVLSRAPENLSALRPYIDEVFSGDLAYPISFVCENMDAVVSAAGASMNVNTFRDRISFYDVDFRGNANLLTEAQRSGVDKFVYVSVFDGASIRSAYTDAHEDFVRLLRQSGIKHAIIRPTGFFSFLQDFVTFARKNRGFVVGNGQNLTNPIHDADVAEVCLNALASAEQEINAGGPDVFTRQEIVELAFEVLGKEPKGRFVPVSVFRLATTLMRPFNRRIAELFEFGWKVSVRDCVAPAVGKRRLEDYFREIAAQSGRG